MFNEQDLKEFPWQVVEKVLFEYPHMTITFKSVSGIKAKAPDKKTFDRFFKECNLNLSSERVLMENKSE